MNNRFRVGDRVIMTLDKHGTCPGPRAKNVEPARNGELYAYQVDKYWVVLEIRTSGELLLKTRRGKNHLVAASDRRLRKASFIERWLFSKRFPVLEDSASHQLDHQTSSSAA